MCLSCHLYYYTNLICKEEVKTNILKLTHRRPKVQMLPKSWKPSPHLSETRKKRPTSKVVLLLKLKSKGGNRCSEANQG
uniref:Uncharacterized protein n=1 Tax=Aegilops tauschii subsp. strangulata TaxID=200361 RepID=A0A453MXT3_AEGTS